MTAIRIATRASDLALVQARSVADRMERELGAPTEIVPLTTTDDIEHPGAARCREIAPAELRQIGGAEDVQAMVGGDEHHVAGRAHVHAVVGA